MAKLEYVEGIGPAFAGKLRGAGIRSTDALLTAGATPKGRKEIASQSGIDEGMVLRWVNHVDLYRIKGIGEEYADLLEAAGVDTVVELGKRKAANLLDAITSTNAKGKRVRQLPTLKQIESWIAQAKQLPRAIHY
jgi:predicted flap endonuclease-1-like 5' DNA nuclease